MDRQTLLIHGFVWLLCFASISMYISRIPVNSSWFVVYEESSKNTTLGVKYSLSKAFIDIHSGSFSTRLLTRELSSSQHHHVKRRSVGDDCLRRKDGSKPLLINRRAFWLPKHVHLHSQLILRNEMTASTVVDGQVIIVCLTSKPLSSVPILKRWLTVIWVMTSRVIHMSMIEVVKMVCLLVPIVVSKNVGRDTCFGKAYVWYL